MFVSAASLVQQQRGMLPQQVSYFGIPQENSSRSSHLHAPGCVCMHGAGKHWSCLPGVPMCSALSRQHLAGVCVSAGPNPGSVLALLSLLIFRYTFHLFGGRMLINNDPVRVLFFCLGTFRARFLCADNTNVSLALRGVELCCFLYLQQAHSYL